MVRTHLAPALCLSQAHSENSKMPLSCKLYTLAGVGLIIAGAAALAKAK